MVMQGCLTCFEHGQSLEPRLDDGFERILTTLMADLALFLLLPFRATGLYLCQPVTGRGRTHVDNPVSVLEQLLGQRPLERVVL